VLNRDDLDEMAMLITGVSFAALDLDHRARIAELTIHDRISFALDELNVSAARLVANSDKTVVSLIGQNGFKGVENHISDIANWFEKSRLFDGIQK
jgi:hypothetical protein